jgi:hypothetical protein
MREHASSLGATCVYAMSATAQVCTTREPPAVTHRTLALVEEIAM